MKLLLVPTLFVLGVLAGCSPTCVVDVYQTKGSSTPPSKMVLRVTSDLLYTRFITWHIAADSGGTTRHISTGDTVVCSGLHAVKNKDTSWSLTMTQLAEGDRYHFFVRIGSDTASFDLPVPAFNITAPLAGSSISSGSFNDTVRYTPAGGVRVWLTYSAGNTSGTDQTNKPDNGAYIIEGFSHTGDASILLKRNFANTLSTLFWSVLYDYWQESKSLNVVIN